MEGRGLRRVWQRRQDRHGGCEYRLRESIGNLLWAQWNVTGTTLTVSDDDGMIKVYKRESFELTP